MTALLSEMPECLPRLNSETQFCAQGAAFSPILTPLELRLTSVRTVTEITAPMEDVIRIENLWDDSVLSSHQPGVPGMKGRGCPGQSRQ